MATRVHAGGNHPARGPLTQATVSHSARIWDYWLGRRDNYLVDREVGDRIAQMLPVPPPGPAT